MQNLSADIDINFRSYKPSDTVWPLSILCIKHKLFTSDALVWRKASPSAFCSLCCWHLAVNNAISEDKMLRQWLFNLSVHRASREPNNSGLNQFQFDMISFNGWAEWLNFFLPYPAIPLSLSSCRSLPVFQGQVLRFILPVLLLLMLTGLGVIKCGCLQGNSQKLVIFFNKQNMYIFISSTKWIEVKCSLIAVVSWIQGRIQVILWGGGKLH